MKKNAYILMGSPISFEIALIACVSIFFSFGFTLPSQAAGMASATVGQLLSAESVAPQTKAKKFKKKKRKTEEDDEMAFGPDDIGPPELGDNGVGVHRDHEGVDVPYKAEVALLMDLALMNKKMDDATTSEKNVELAVEWLFILGAFEVGPDFSYQMLKTSQTEVTINQTTQSTAIEVVDRSTTAYTVGGLFKWNLTDIDHAALVPFAYAGAALRGSETKLGAGKAAKSSGSVFKVGGGLNIFLDSNVAFNPRVEYRLESDKADDDTNAVETKMSGFKALFGLAVFI